MTAYNSYYFNPPRPGRGKPREMIFEIPETLFKQKIFLCSNCNTQYISQPIVCKTCEKIARKAQDRWLKFDGDPMAYLYEVLLYDEKECFLKVGYCTTPIITRMKYIHYQTGYKSVLLDKECGHIVDIVEKELAFHERCKEKHLNKLKLVSPNKYTPSASAKQWGESECYVLPSFRCYEDEIKDYLNELYSFNELMITFDEVSNEIFGQVINSPILAANYKLKTSSDDVFCQ